MYPRTIVHHFALARWGPWVTLAACYPSWTRGNIARLISGFGFNCRARMPDPLLSKPISHDDDNHHDNDTTKRCDNQMKWAAMAGSGIQVLCGAPHDLRIRVRRRAASFESGRIKASWMSWSCYRLEQAKCFVFQVTTSVGTGSPGDKWRGLSLLCCAISAAALPSIRFAKPRTSFHQLWQLQKTGINIFISGFNVNTRINYSLRTTAPFITEPATAKLDQGVDDFKFLADTLHFPADFLKSPEVIHYWKVIQHMQLGIQDGRTGFYHRRLCTLDCSRLIQCTCCHHWTSFTQKVVNLRRGKLENCKQPQLSLPNRWGRGPRTGRRRQSPGVSSTASQAGETDQTTRTDSTEHPEPESCQLASPARNLRRRKAHLYSVLKQHMSFLQAKRPKQPNMHRTIFQKQQRSVIRLGLNGSVDSDPDFNFLLHCRKNEMMSKSSGAVHFVSRLWWIWSSKF